MGADEGGAAGNYWTTLETPPSFVPTPFYLSAGGVLSSTPPSTSGDVTFTYDPLDPVPTEGGNNLEIKCGPLDQRPLESRPDVLVYTTAPLTAPLAITGGLEATVWISTNVTDTDVVVKLIDVYPPNDSGEEEGVEVVSVLSLAGPLPPIIDPYALSLADP